MGAETRKKQYAVNILSTIIFVIRLFKISVMKLSCEVQTFESIMNVMEVGKCKGPRIYFTPPPNMKSPR